MSLIHEALKKAQDGEKEKAPLGSGTLSFHHELDAPKATVPRRTIVLAAGLAVAVGVFVYLKFFSGPSAPAPTTAAATTATTAIPVGGTAAVPGAPVVTEGQTPDQLKRKAIEAVNMNDMDAAWANIQAATMQDPKDAEAWNNQGLIARKRGDMAKAREAYQKAIDLKADYPEALNNLAVLEMQSGNNARAKELLEKATSLSPSYPEANFHLGLLYDQSGDKAKAVDYYKRFLKVSKKFPSTTVDSVRDRVMEIEP